jgi:hypothetical protein
MPSPMVLAHKSFQQHVENSTIARVASCVELELELVLNATEMKEVNRDVPKRHLQPAFPHAAVGTKLLVVTAHAQAMQSFRKEAVTVSAGLWLVLGLLPKQLHDLLQT